MRRCVSGPYGPGEWRAHQNLAFRYFANLIFMGTGRGVCPRDAKAVTRR